MNVGAFMRSLGSAKAPWLTVDAAAESRRQEHCGETGRFLSGAVEDSQHEPQERIDTCMNCPYPECRNCWEQARDRKRKYLVEIPLQVVGALHFLPPPLAVQREVQHVVHCLPRHTVLLVQFIQRRRLLLHFRLRGLRPAGVVPSLLLCQILRDLIGFAGMVNGGTIVLRDELLRIVALQGFLEIVRAGNEPVETGHEAALVFALQEWAVLHVLNGLQHTVHAVFPDAGF